MLQIEFSGILKESFSAKEISVLLLMKWCSFVTMKNFLYCFEMKGQSLALLELNKI